jgi:hypothetical protein
MDIFGIPLMMEKKTSADPDEIAGPTVLSDSVRRGVLWRFTNGFFGGSHF